MATEIRIRKEHLSEVKDSFNLDDEESIFWISINRYHSPDSLLKLDIEDIMKDKERGLEGLQKIKEKLEPEIADNKEYRISLNRILGYEKLLEGSSTVKIKNLKHFMEVFKVELRKKTKWEWVFSHIGGEMRAYRVSGMSYNHATEFTPAHISVVLSFLDFDYEGKDRSHLKKFFSIYMSDIRESKTTLGELLEKKGGYHLETEALMEQYESSLDKLKKIRSEIGIQYIGSGSAQETGGSRWGSSSYLLSRGSAQHRLVTDEDPSVKLEAIIDPESGVRVPTRFRVKCYDLTRYCGAIVSIDDLELYEYDSSVKDKLVLPETSSALLDILIEHEDDLMEDIIKGKTGGIIVLATGEAGLGKTLTAEVYSEIMEKPLYTIQSSQLGMKIETIEENLQNALSNASRWNAILLIDEADTYIHERGGDIQQNCIVGVFLRTLEYYNGVLFMTSNRPEIVDDAIMSRCTAHIHYSYPDMGQLERIWTILATQFKVEMSAEVIRELVEFRPKMSGRDIKNTVKLMKMVAKKTGEKCDVRLLEKLMPFMNYNSKQQ